MTAASAPITSVAAPVHEPDGVAKIGFYAFCFFLFALFSRVFDLYLFRLHLPGISEAIAVFAALVSGGIMRVSRTRSGMALLALTVWLFVTIPTAWWRGGSIGIVGGHWLKGIAAFVMATALIVTVRQCRKALFIIGTAGAVGAVLLFAKGEMIKGRLMLGQGRFKNSNDASMTLLLCLPCLALILIDSKVNKLLKVPVLGCILALLLAIAKTGSRAGLVGFLVLCVIVFLQVSVAGKAKMAAVAVIILAAFFTVVPHSLRDRYVTVFSNKTANATVDEQQLLNSATGSSEDRMQRLKDSLTVTFQKPLFGVGPGNFAPYFAHLYQMQGRIYNWNGTHNTYTQYSSETGIPGLVLYLLALMFSIKDLGKIYRRAKKLPGEHAHDLATLASAVRASFIAFCVCTFFEHVGYETLVPVMVGLAAAVITAGELELASMEKAPPVAIPSTVPLAMPRRRAARQSTGPEGAPLPAGRRSPQTAVL